MYNSFCHYCTGKDKNEIVYCEFKSCPFWRFRFADLDWQVKKQIERAFNRTVKKYRPGLEKLSRS